jgi:hypothetical protein
MTKKMQKCKKLILGKRQISLLTHQKQEGIKTSTYPTCGYSGVFTTCRKIN